MEAGTVLICEDAVDGPMPMKLRIDKPMRRKNAMRRARSARRWVGFLKLKSMRG